MINVSKPFIGQEEKNAVLEVLDSGMLAKGLKTKLFEESFAKKYGFTHAVAVNSGTAAIHTALYAHGIREGDEVITTPFTFVATANTILMQNAKPVFVDISEEDYNIDPDKIEEKITSKTKAILVVNIFGQTPDMDKIFKICKKHNLVLIEDACQSVGAKFGEKYCGNIGDSACFSLYATKNMMSGEGGVFTTNNDDVAQVARRFTSHGQNEKDRYDYLHIGYNYRMTDLAASIANVQLSRIDSLNAQRMKNAKQLTEGLKGIKGIILPKIFNNRTHVFHQYSIRVTPEFKMSREALMEHLSKNDIQTAIYYPKTLHLFDHLKKFGYHRGDFPVAEKISKEIVSLPVHPLVTQKEIEHIIKVVKDCAK